MYEVNGFIVHFFDRQKIEHLAEGYEIIDISRFQEGELPRELFMVMAYLRPFQALLYLYGLNLRRRFWCILRQLSFASLLATSFYLF
ncbi:MAG: methylase involved in ubiquinone/menaquinone biosynthesis [Firmicutes bacterium]|nr:methylase involved in ubiquinone/menaquinone biosynthesis [Bacillota bacterium]